MGHNIDASPRPTPRLIGVVYLLYFVTALTGGMLLKGIVNPHDAAATAQNILAHEAVYRAGVGIGLLGNLVYLALGVLFCGLFARVNWTVSLFMALVNVVGCAVQIFAAVLQTAPFVVLRNAQLAHALTPPQLQALTLLSVSLYAQSFDVSFALFALWDVLIGYLIFRSTFLPRWLGVLWMIGGAIGLSFLYPPFAHPLWSVIIPAAGLPELVLMVWLLWKGVDLPAWQRLARVDGDDARRTTDHVVTA